MKKLVVCLGLLAAPLAYCAAQSLYGNSLWHKWDYSDFRFIRHEKTGEIRVYKHVGPGPYTRYVLVPITDDEWESDEPIHVVKGKGGEK